MHMPYLMPMASLMPTLNPMVLLMSAFDAK
jgi:hypothetical protein